MVASMSVPCLTSNPRSSNRRLSSANKRSPRPRSVSSFRKRLIVEWSGVPSVQPRPTKRRKELRSRNASSIAGSDAVYHCYRIAIFSIVSGG